MGGVDKEVFEENLGRRVQIVNNEFFTISGTIKAVYNNSVAIFTDGRLKYLSFSRILEVRPYKRGIL